MAIVTLAPTGEGGVRYEFDDTKCLGEGGMGILFRGVRYDPSGARREVAIKHVKQQALADGGVKVLERARREASVRVKNDNLVEMLAFLDIEDTDEIGMPRHWYYVVSELLEGVTLDRLLQADTTDAEGRSIPFAEEMLHLRQTNPYRFALDITADILRGLIALHNAGYIHRDLDPTNVMLTTDRRVVILDYGISRRIAGSAQGRNLTSMGEFVGKAAYAPPELITGDLPHQDYPSDLYSVGVIFFHLLTGRLPYEGAHHEMMKQHLHARFPIERVRQKGTADVIARAVQRSPQARYSSAAEMLAAMTPLRHLPYPQVGMPGWMLWSIIGAGTVAAASLAVVIASYL